MEQKHTPGPEELFPALGEPDWEKISKIAKPSTDGSKFTDIVRGGWSEGEMVGYASCMIDKVKPLQQDASEWRRRFYQSEVEKKELTEQVSALTKENERLKEANLIAAGFAQDKIDALTEQVEKLTFQIREKDDKIDAWIDETVKRENELSRLREERKKVVQMLEDRMFQQTEFKRSINIPPGWIQQEINFIRLLLSKFPEVPNE